MVIKEMKELMISGAAYWIYPFKKFDTRRLNEKIKELDEAVKQIRTNNITKTNSLLNVVSMLKELGLKSPKRVQENDDPWYKRRIEGDIKLLLAHIDILERKT